MVSRKSATSCAGRRRRLHGPVRRPREYAASRTLTESPEPDVEIVSADLAGKVREPEAEDTGFDICLCGGSAVAGEPFGEVDELVVKTHPVVPGTGMPTFGTGFAFTEFVPRPVRSLGDGVVVRTYRTKRRPASPLAAARPETTAPGPPRTPWSAPRGPGAEGKTVRQAFLVSQKILSIWAM
ncbi:dihydrofolate reductase family protein [Streptomyces sp. NPDC057336]|uniref:dihydrofolate reductase family protein n=1 Tax=Streptomyces sp. NPDC057336 TaxID=3346102 RepID=UPI0036335AEE